MEPRPDGDDDFLPARGPVGRWLRHVLTPAACAELLARCEAERFTPTGLHYPKGYRDNDRLVFDDAQLAASLFELTKARLPPRLELDGASWVLDGLNPRFRACRYRDGQAFCVHRDGPYVPTQTRRSWLTLQFYLNAGDQFRGGRTRFYADHTAEVEWAALVPDAGSAIVFDHRAWHDGEAVTAGTKVVLRTDVLYARQASAPVTAGPGQTLVGRHRGYVWRALVCADGSVVSAGRDGTVRRWPGDEVLQVDGGSVTALAQAHDGRLWYGTRAGRVGMVGQPAALEGQAAVLSLTPHLEGVAAATAAGQVLALDGAGQVRWASQAHEGWAWAVSAVGAAVFSAGDDGWVCRADQAGPARRVHHHARPLRALAVRPDGALVLGDAAGWVQVVTQDGVPGPAFRAHQAAVTSLALGPSGTLATAGEDGQVRVWGPGMEAPLTQLASTDFVTSVALTAHGQVVWAGYDGGVWRAAMT